MAREEEMRKALGKDYSEFLAFRDLKWVGPFTIEKLLDNCLDDSFGRPPESRSVYLVSQKAWEVRPSDDCIPLYVGSNTGKSPRFRTRIGDLIADMFGFYQIQADTGHSSGGRSLHLYCKDRDLNPKKLYIGWLRECNCVRCAENYIFDLLDPRLNIKRPPTCKRHAGQ